MTANTITVTIDLDKLAKYGDPDETVVAFFTRLAADARVGMTCVWTKNAAYLGEIHKKGDLT